MSVTIVEAPEVEPVSVVELKNYLRVDEDFTLDDSLIQSLAVAARRMIERGWDCALVTQTLQLTLDRFPIPGNPYLWQQYSFGFWYDRIPMMSLSGSWWPDRAAVFIPRPPLQAVLAVGYIDMTGTQQTLSPASYLVDTARMPGRITPNVGGWWPYTQTQVDAVQIQYTAGYGDAAAVPDTIKQAIRSMVYQAYENRAEMPELSPGVVNLLMSEWGGEYY